jgi:hypothetical protein
MHCLLRCLMVLARGEASEHAEVLVPWHENAVLRRQIGRVRYQRGDRLCGWRHCPGWSRYRWGEVFAVNPATLLVWHRRLVASKWDLHQPPAPGVAVHDGPTLEAVPDCPGSRQSAGPISCTWTPCSGGVATP